MPTAHSDAIPAFLLDAYQGEVLGEAFYALMAEREQDAARVPTWRRLERLERHVKDLLGDAIARRGVRPPPDPARRETGRQAAIGLSALGFGRVVEAIAGSIRGEIEGMRAGAKALPDDLADLGRLFVAHEEAQLAFFERPDDADDPVVRFLEETAAPAEPPIPEGLQLMPLDPAFQAEPQAVMAALRERAPTHRDRQLDRVVVSGHDVVRQVAYDLEFLVDPRKSLEGDPVRMFVDETAEREPSMLFLDDPEHKRLRNLVSRAFTPRAVRALRPVIEQVAAELLDAVEREGAAEFDLIDRLAGPLPAIAIARILGVDPARQADFKRWSVASSEAFFDPFAGEEKQRLAEVARVALEECFRDEIARRRRTPADDLIGTLVAAEREGDRLDEVEIVTMCGLLLIAGNVTTTDLIGNGVKALLDHPSELAKLRERPELIDNAVEEMLRFDPPVQTTGRIAPRDCEIDGVPVAKGESITVLLAAANRDPAVYPDPDRFDIEREDTHHHAFGGGAHLCLGAHLARAEAQVAIGALVGRYPKLRPAGSPIEWKKTPGFRGLAGYPVRID